MTVGSRISQDNFQYFYRSKSLPHLFDVNKPIFITFRLKFSLPKSVMEELNSRKAYWLTGLNKLDKTNKEIELKHKDAKVFVWFDELITNSNETPELFMKPEIADIVSTALKFHDNQRYELLAYCIMPNHVHVLINPMLQSDETIFPVSHITYTWKKYTANKINKSMGGKGNLWQHESYDHLVKDENELYHCLEYIINNPVKAGLVDKWSDWLGTWIREDLKPG